MKTLKDFDAEDSCENNGYQECKDVLRAEAIKDIKRIESGTSYFCDDFSQGQVEWIKHFFNLTDKDLE